MDRREFIRRLAQLTTATAAAGVVGCHDGADPEREDDAPELVLIATSDRAEGTRRALEALRVDPVDEQVFLKPNFNSSDPPPASTHPAVLTAIIEHFHDHQASSITVGDRAGMEPTREVMEKLGIFDMADDLNFEPLVFDELDIDDWAIIDHDHHHWQQGFALPKPMLDADVYVQTCCLKTHRYGGDFTMAIKNNVGLAAKRVPDDGYDYMSELHNSDYQRLMIAEINEVVPSQLIVLDAVEGFYERGPEVGPVAEFSAMIAGYDPVLIDALGVALLRRHGTTPEVEEGPISGLDQIARCLELDIGSANPADSEVHTPDDASEALLEELLTQF